MTLTKNQGWEIYRVVGLKLSNAMGIKLRMMVPKTGFFVRKKLPLDLFDHIWHTQIISIHVYDSSIIVRLKKSIDPIGWIKPQFLLYQKQ